MATADQYRVKAANLRAKAEQESSPSIRTQFENLALSYLRLAEQAERNSKTDLVYETPPRPPDQDQPVVQQQQQIQPDSDEKA